MARATAGITLLSFSAFLAEPARAGIFAAPFSDFYSSQSFGPISLDTGGNIPAPYGGLTFLDTDTLLIGGNANAPEAAIYSVDVVRDSNGRITGYSGPASFYANVPGVATSTEENFGGIDGGLTIAPSGVIAYTTYSDNNLGQILPGTTNPAKFINLTELGVQASTGGLNFVPVGLPGEGRLKITSYDTDNFYDATVSYNPDGTFEITSISEISLQTDERSRGLEGINFVDTTYPGFNAASILLSEFNSSNVVTFEVDENGNPIVATEQEFITGFPRSGGPEGIAIDPVTGDILLSVYGSDSASQVLLIKPEPPEPTEADNDPFDDVTPVDYSSGTGVASGEVSTGNQVYSFTANAGELLSLQVDVTETLPGIAYFNDDSVAYLYNSRGEILAVGEDTATGLNSRILNYLVPESGTYYAAVTTAGNNPILELGAVNTLLGFENEGLGNLAYDFSISSQMLSETARLFDIALAVDPTNPVGNVLIDGNSVLSIDLNGSRNTDLTGPLTINLDTENNALTFDNFEFILQFAEPFASTNINDVLNSLETSTITAVIPPDEFVEQILFFEQSIPGKSVPEPASILSLLGVGIWGASSKLKRKSRY
ncbi:hypothetical protein WN50_17265 [Limnoraphis robusta CS-951]|uniref:Ice-binding protein C-terminal domain-containing protein n=1 Tax=Limnoraphis robusta CS-951 TaxID=1637645 RepID=A0A0F5YDR2_9CYAN|nr:hypothetical protein WN50_17265 [Limnoraphis robusta CS-951]